MGRDEEGVEEAEGLSLVEGEGEAVVAVCQDEKSDGEDVLREEQRRLRWTADEALYVANRRSLFNCCEDLFLA